MTSNEKFIAVKELSSGTIYKRTDGILILRQPAGRDSASLAELKEQQAVFLDIQKGALSPLMVVVDQLKKLENEEKMFLKSSVTQFASKICIVANSPMPFFLFNMFLFLFRPALPAKVFRNEKDALGWLKLDNKN